MDEVGSWLHGTPPARIDGHTLSLQRWADGDLDEQLEAILESTHELTRWMPWATGYDRAACRAFLTLSRAGWDACTTFAYAIRSRAGQLVGGVGLHARIGTGGLETGYWVRTSATRRGYASRAAALATAIGLGLEGVTFVEIHHDRANKVSGRIPARLGYHHIETVARDREAPGASGIALHWRMTADDYVGSPAARMVFDETVAGDTGRIG
jgi:RimJ/RimL family protein N-acetyltransferase